MYSSCENVRRVVVMVVMVMVGKGTRTSRLANPAHRLFFVPSLVSYPLGVLILPRTIRLLLIQAGIVNPFYRTMIHVLDEHKTSLYSSARSLQGSGLEK